MLGCCVTLAGLAACGGGSARGTLPRTSPSATVFASSVGVLAEGSPLDSVAPASAGLDLSVLAAFVPAAVALLFGDSAGLSVAAPVAVGAVCAAAIETTPFTVTIAQQRAMSFRRLLRLCHVA